MKTPLIASPKANQSRGSGKPAAPWNKRVLIVDDAPTNRKLINRLLRDRILYRDEAIDGNDACEKLRKCMESNITVDVVLLDYYMPNCDGPTAARKMRNMGYKNLVIGITGNGHEEDVQLFKDSGADHVLMKPLNMDAFWEIMQGKCDVVTLKTLVVLTSCLS